MIMLIVDTSKVEALKSTQAEAQKEADEERTARRKHEARLDEVQQELTDAINKCESLERNIADQETELAKEWKRVGTLFQNIYPQLTELCEYKSDYWVNPDIYSERKVEELGITIRNIEAQLKKAKEKLL